ncbi:Uncharacterised protein [Nocardia otitidiscaviarum]|uniref:Uncharacterized protein n=1 Tax=Nocardia otitidiscaviarum TaxID=1823 RepID=A0A378Y8J2_9NOCA|nr:hypothetical protein [Nocardia otitidiscaviarum]SUA72619.1 Uncharacterised protein [Nocardia otitidiscaviarum]SUA72679.1 Uncharacterised protein [Nocardia otitidiscaviarum]
MTADEPAVERFEVDLEMLLSVFLDGMHSGGTTILGHFAPYLASDAGLAASAILAPIAEDPLALESLRHLIRRRLRGDITPETTEVRVYGSE